MFRFRIVMQRISLAIILSFFSSASNSQSISEEALAICQGIASIVASGTDGTVDYNQGQIRISKSGRVQVYEGEKLTESDEFSFKAMQDCIERFIRLQRGNSPEEGSIELEVCLLIKAAHHHYLEYGTRFERRVASAGAKVPDLIRQYESKGIIYYYGSEHLSRRSKLSAADRSAVAERYLGLFEDVFAKASSARERKSLVGIEARCG